MLLPQTPAAFKSRQSFVLTFSEAAQHLFLENLAKTGRKRAIPSTQQGLKTAPTPKRSN